MVTPCSCSSVSGSMGLKSRTRRCSGVSAAAWSSSPLFLAFVGWLAGHRRVKIESGANIYRESASSPCGPRIVPPEPTMAGTLDPRVRTPGGGWENDKCLVG